MKKSKHVDRNSDGSFCSPALTPNELKTLRILGDRNKSPIRCGWLGDMVFHCEGKPHNGSAPYARQQGKIMKRLEAKGLASMSFRDDTFGWIITEAGLLFVR